MRISQGRVLSLSKLLEEAKNEKPAKHLSVWRV